MNCNLDVLILHSGKFVFNSKYNNIIRNFRQWHMIRSFGLMQCWEFWQKDSIRNSLLHEYSKMWAELYIFMVSYSSHVFLSWDLKHFYILYFMLSNYLICESRYGMTHSCMVFPCIFYLDYRVFQLHLHYRLSTFNTFIFFIDFCF